MDWEARWRQLAAAVRTANSSLLGFEGIDLLYIMKNMGDSEEQIAVIKDVIDGKE